MKTISDYFGTQVFDDRVMRTRLPEDIYSSLRNTIDQGVSLDSEVANVVAEAMKNWALEKGATHYTHWFQPLNCITAEKHDSFISPSPDGGVIMEFSGKELIKGEPDASAFPSGGLRAIFEARGYTAWDPTSYAFIKDNTLCIPTAFCSHSGEALDKKTPLLRSMQCINKQSLRILRLFGNNDVKCVTTSVGAEQEYFLIDKAMFDKRPDLIFCGRTLFGCIPPKGQELGEHYFGVIKPRIAEFMKDLDEELWKLGILAKTEHNEVAPAQHELAPIYTKTNVATDHNQLIMEMMQKVASRHGLVCLLHEKPFAGVNGSGKHNNWSISTDTGVNLLTPGETPYQNARFLLFLCGVIQAVDDYQDLLRLSVATAGNDCRLGAHEAPPAVVSMFLGDELTAVLDAIESDTPYNDKGKTVMKLGVHALPKFIKDTTDRNRTSPFAYTGNKFEFRMLGSSNSIADTNVILNTAVAESLKKYADILEKAENFESTLHDLIKNTVKAHKRIIFNGNGYDNNWINEAVNNRGLCNYPTTPDVMPSLLKEKNMKLLTENKVMTDAEIKSRYEIMLENYCKTVNIEALTMLDMTKKYILPAVISYSNLISKAINNKRTAIPEFEPKAEIEILKKLSVLSEKIYDNTEKLDNDISTVKAITDISAESKAIRDIILKDMSALRKSCDDAEAITSKEFWPFPAYSELLFGVR